MSSQKGILFLRWAMPELGYRWDGFRKPRNQVLSRIRNRISELELSGGFGEYRKYLEKHPEEWKTLDKLCDVTISKFFRDRKVWEQMRDEILPNLFDDKSVSIWSIGCCNGEEAYSLAVISDQLTMNRDRQVNSAEIKILATDRNEQVLNRATKGRFPAGALKEMTDEEISKYFREIDDESEDDYQVEERLKEYVDFEKRDIRESFPDQTFDLVLCRNLVFTYFTEERQVQFLEKLNPHMAGGGFLVVGSNESFPDTEWLKTESKIHRVFTRK